MSRMLEVVRSVALTTLLVATPACFPSSTVERQGTLELRAGETAVLVSRPPDEWLRLHSLVFDENERRVRPQAGEHPGFDIFTVCAEREGESLSYSANKWRHDNGGLDGLAAAYEDRARPLESVACDVVIAATRTVKLEEIVVCAQVAMGIEFRAYR